MEAISGPVSAYISCDGDLSCVPRNVSDDRVNWGSVQKDLPSSHALHHLPSFLSLLPSHRPYSEDMNNPSGHTVSLQISSYIMLKDLQDLLERLFPDFPDFKIRVRKSFFRM